MRLGHASKNTVSHMLNQDIVNGLHANAKPDKVDCEPCIEEKWPQTSHRRTTSPKNSSVGDIIFSDVCGPMQVASSGLARYFVHLIDGKST